LKQGLKGENGVSLFQVFGHGRVPGHLTDKGNAFLLFLKIYSNLFSLKFNSCFALSSFT